MKPRLNAALFLLTPPIFGKFRSRFAYIRNNRKSLKINTYRSTEIAKVVAEKTKLSLLNKAENPLQDLEFTNLMVAILFAITRTGKSQITLLEFGGAAGNHFRQLPQEILKHISKWVVLETPEMVSECKQFENRILKFTSSNQGWKTYCEDIDLVYSSCAIQYAENPANQLDRLIDKQPSVVCLNRIALTTGNKQVEIPEFSQILGNGPQVSGDIGQTNQIVKYLSRAMSKSEFESKISTDYKIISRIDHGPSSAQRAAGIHNVSLYSYLAITNQS